MPVILFHPVFGYQTWVLINDDLDRMTSGLEAGERFFPIDA
jgi:hypothetical protein